MGKESNIVWVEIYQGYYSRYRSIWDIKRKSWRWVIKYIDGNGYMYEHYKTYTEAVNRAKEIAKEKEIEFLYK